MKKIIFTTFIFMLTLAGCTSAPTPTNNTSSSTPTGSATTTNPESTTSESTEYTTPTTSGSNESTTPAPTGTTTSTTTAPKLQTFRNTEYKFEFQYPQDFVLAPASYGNLGEKIAQVSLSSAQYPNTNFDDAGFAVSAGSATSLSKCLSMDPPDGGNGFKDTVTINGVKFYWTNGTGAGAGNLYDSKIYRNFTSPNCLEFSVTIYTSNIGNYPPGTVTEVDKAPIWKKLDDILKTVKFTK